MRERLKEIIGEVRDLVEQAQASLEDRPVLQRVLTALREKVREVELDKPDEGKDETEAIDEDQEDEELK